MTMAWEHLKPVLLNSLSDVNSACRESAALALTGLCASSIFKAGDNVRELASVIQGRFTVANSIRMMFGSNASDASDQKGLVEDIEEVRVVLILLVKSFMAVAESSILAATDILCTLVASACVDPAPDVKREGCACLMMLVSKAHSALTEPQWESLLGGIATGTHSALMHQHAKVREAAIVAVGSMMPLAPVAMWEKVIPKVKGIYLDRHAKVRIAVVRVVHDWLVASCANLHTSSLLVQLLMGESDEVPEVSEYAEGVLAKVGSHFYPEASGPLEAIESLLEVHLPKIIPEVVGDVVEWRSSTRLKAAQTLVVLIKYVGDKCEDHLDSFLPALFKGCRDDDDDVAKIIFKASEAIGEVVTPSHFTKRILDHAVSGKYEAIQRVSHLQVLACMLATADAEQVIEALPIMFDGFRSLVMTSEGSLMVHQQALDCVAAVVDNCGRLCRPEAEGLVEVLVSLRALNLTDERFTAEVDETTGRLASVLGIGSIGALHGMCAAPRLSQLLSWADVAHLTPRDVPWNKDSPELSQLETILLMADAPALVTHMELLLRAVVACSDRDHEPEFRLRVVKMLAALMTEDVIASSLKSHYDTLIHSVVKPCGKWFAGRMIERLREAAMALLTLVIRKRVGSAGDFADSEEEILAVIRANIDDDWVPELRRCATDTLGEYIHRRADGGRLDGVAAGKMTEDLMKRLDDKLDPVRLQAQKSLILLFQNVPQDYSVDDWNKALDTLMVHLDDPNAEIRSGVQDVLSTVVAKRPADVLARCLKVRGVHQSPVHCDYLIQQCKMQSPNFN